jgi:hypothetical protein
MTAIAAASGTRSWLAAHHMSWLTPRRLRAITIGLAVVALLVSSVRISGSSGPSSHPPTQSVAAAHR